MSTNRPRYVNRWILISISISIAGFLSYCFIALSPWTRFPHPILGFAIFLSTGLACIASGVIWAQLYAKQQLGTFCTRCNYDMHAQDVRTQKCPECGNDSTSNYPIRGWRDMVIQSPVACFFSLALVSSSLACSSSNSLITAVSNNYL